LSSGIATIVFLIILFPRDDHVTGAQ